MTFNFRCGDIVRLTTVGQERFRDQPFWKKHGRPLRLGSLQGIVIERTSGGFWRVWLRRYDVSWLFNDDEIELVERPEVIDDHR